MNKIKKTTIKPATNDKTFDPCKIGFLPFSADGQPLPVALVASGVKCDGTAELVDNRKGLTAYRAALLALEYGERVTAFVALALNDRRSAEAFDATEKARADFAEDNTTYRNARIAASNIGKRLTSIILASGVEIMGGVGDILSAVASGSRTAIKELDEKAKAAHIDGANECAEIYAAAVRDVNTAKDEAEKTRARLSACLKDEWAASGAFVSRTEFWKKLNG